MFANVPRIMTSWLPRRAPYELKSAGTTPFAMRYLPAGLSASAPWLPLTSADGSRAYRVGHGPYDWPAKVVFGPFQEMEIEVPGAVLRVALLDGSPAVDPDLVRQWLHVAGGDSQHGVE